MYCQAGSPNRKMRRYTTASHPATCSTSSSVYVHTGPIHEKGPRPMGLGRFFRSSCNIVSGRYLHTSRYCQIRPSVRSFRRPHAMLVLHLSI